MSEGIHDGVGDIVETGRTGNPESRHNSLAGRIVDSFKTVIQRMVECERQFQDRNRASHISSGATPPVDQKLVNQIKNDIRIRKRGQLGHNLHTGNPVAFERFVSLENQRVLTLLEEHAQSDGNQEILWKIVSRMSDYRSVLELANQKAEPEYKKISILVESIHRKTFGLNAFMRGFELNPDEENQLTELSALVSPLPSQHSAEDTPPSLDPHHQGLAS